MKVPLAGEDEASYTSSLDDERWHLWEGTGLGHGGIALSRARTKRKENETALDSNSAPLLCFFRSLPHKNCGTRKVPSVANFYTQWL